MNAAVQPISTIQQGIAAITGRIVARRRINTQAGPVWLYILRLPAADEFTAPATVEVRSADQFGEVNDIAKCRVRIGGYGRSFEVTDPETGRKSRQQAANNTLEVIL